jgi:hypothetical protein
MCMQCISGHGAEHECTAHMLHAKRPLSNAITAQCSFGGLGNNTNCSAGVQPVQPVQSVGSYSQHHRLADCHTIIVLPMIGN